MSLSAHIYPFLQDYKKEIHCGKVVFTNGCFDILHAGHVQYLAAARQLGDKLILGLNSDASVKQLKGKDRPLHTWSDRAQVLAALRCVDVIIGFEEATPINLIKGLRPDIICKGGDYKQEEMIGKDFVEGYGGEVIILPFVKGHSTTATIEKISAKDSNT